MPPKRRGKASKASTASVKEEKVELSSEEQQRQDQVELMLKGFNMESKEKLTKINRDLKSVKDSLSKLFKLELMKLPKATKEMKWDEYVVQCENENPLELVDKVESLMDDTDMQKVDEKLSAIKSTAKKTRIQKNADPTPIERGSRRGRGEPLNDSTNLVTPAMSKRGIKGKSTLATPLGQSIPTAGSKTPMITPKFDTTLGRTFQRVAKENEVLVSLSGSPVAPQTQLGPKPAVSPKDSVYLALPGGLAFNVPTAENGAELETCPIEIDEEQAQRLEIMNSQITKLLKLRSQNV